jgi:hypothetical protein
LQNLNLKKKSEVSVREKGLFGSGISRRERVKGEGEGKDEYDQSTS